MLIIIPYIIRHSSATQTQDPTDPTSTQTLKKRPTTTTTGGKVQTSKEQARRKEALRLAKIKAESGPKTNPLVCESSRTKKRNFDLWKRERDDEIFHKKMRLASKASAVSDLKENAPAFANLPKIKRQDSKLSLGSLLRVSIFSTNQNSTNQNARVSTSFGGVELFCLVEKILTLIYLCPRGRI